MKRASAKPRDLSQLRETTKLQMAEEKEPTPRRRRVFRLIALALPILFLAAAEVLLRAAGYGYPTGFALKRTHGGKTIYVDNQQFARRYFPPGLERGPHPFLFEADKPANTTRVFVFGESAAMGDPEPAYGFARALEVLLEGRYPGRNFEVINAGVTAINSHVVRNIASDLAGCGGDIWVVYMGNNEVVGPYGAGTVFGTQTPSLGVIRATVALKKLRVGQLVEDLRSRLTRKAGPATWEGMEMFLQQQIAANDPRMAKVYRHFEANLDDILRTGAEAGAKVLLSTVASNLKDCAPFASAHGSGFARTNEWAKMYEAGAGRERTKDYAGALEEFRRAAALDDRHAELHFRIGRCELVLGRTNEAAKSFALARDLDTLRFRADSRINDIIRARGDSRRAESRGPKDIRFVDIAEVVNRASTNGIAGEEFLYEHVHFNFEGNYLVAGAFAEVICEMLSPPRETPRGGTRPTDTPGGGSAPTAFPSLAECAQRLALTDWDRLEVTSEVTKRLQQPPFTHQLGHAERIAAWEKVRSDLAAQWQPEAFARAVDTYKEALGRSPRDWLLHENFAKLCQQIGEPQTAEREWRAVIELMPHYPAGYYSLANVLDGLGRGEEALEFFSKALRAKPNSVEARNGMGLVLAAQGKKTEAMDQYRRALAQKPDFAEARVNLGQLLAQQGDVEQARVQYELALRYNSNSAAAHINLGKLLAQEQKTAEAIHHYREALRIAPENAIGHYNLGNALAAAENPAAAHHFEQAVKYNPNFAEARYNLGLQLARQGRNQEALTQFAEAVRIKPGFVEGHLNYGVALAKNRRMGEAIEQFKIVLKYEPDNPAARKMLDQALAIRGQ